MSESGGHGSEDAIAILGGTGDQGLGLALRFAQAGRSVLIGSRKLDRAVAAAKEVLAAVPDAQVVGLENAAATKRAPIVILSVPFEHSAGTVRAIEDFLSAGQIVVSMAVPLAAAIGDGAVRTLGIWQGSCAELVASLVPDGVAVVSAFQNVSAHRLQNLAARVECDVIFVVGSIDPDIGEAVHVELRIRIELFICRQRLGIGAKDARQYHRDIVSPTVPVGGIHEYSACGSEIGSVITQNLGQGDIVDHVRQPVGAK